MDVWFCAQAGTSATRLEKDLPKDQTPRPPCAKRRSSFSLDFTYHGCTSRRLIGRLMRGECERGLGAASGGRELRILAVSLEKDRKIRVGVLPKGEECLVLFAARGKLAL